MLFVYSIFYRFLGSDLDSFKSHLSSYTSLWRNPPPKYTYVKNHTNNSYHTSVINFIEGLQ